METTEQSSQDRGTIPDLIDTHNINALAWQKSLVPLPILRPFEDVGLLGLHNPSP